MWEVGIFDEKMWEVGILGEKMWEVGISTPCVTPPSKARGCMLEVGESGSETNLLFQTSNLWRFIIIQLVFWGGSLS